MTERKKPTSKAAEAESRARLILSAWQFWMGVAYFGLVVVVIALIVEFSHINSAEQLAIREQATRITATTANANAQYRQCLASIPTLRRVNRFVEGVQTLHRVLLENAVSTHELATPKSGLFKVQAKNIERLRVSVRLVSDIHFPVPTKAACASARRQALSR